MEFKTKAVLISVGVVIIVGALSLSGAKVSNLGGGVDAGSVPRSVAASSSAQTIGTSSTLLVASSTPPNYRAYAVLRLAGVNRGNVSCKLDNDMPAVANQGVPLSTTTPEYRITSNEGNRYWGGIRCIADVATVVAYTEYASNN